MTRCPDQLSTARRAQTEGPIDIGYRVHATPIGPLLLVATEVGLLRIAFASQDHQQVLAELAATVSPQLQELPLRLDPVARQLDEFFVGRRRDFTLPLDLRLTAGFYRMVHQALAAVGYGHTRSYTELAAAAGRPRAVRAAASACARNPLPLVLPCHRIVRSDGTLGGYAGGLAAKRYLLDLENPGADLPGTGCREQCQ